MCGPCSGGKQKARGSHLRWRAKPYQSMPGSTVPGGGAGSIRPESNRTDGATALPTSRRVHGARVQVRHGELSVPPGLHELYSQAGAKHTQLRLLRKPPPGVSIRALRVARSIRHGSADEHDRALRRRRVARGTHSQMCPIVGAGLSAHRLRFAGLASLRSTSRGSRSRQALRGRS